MHLKKYASDSKLIFLHFVQIIFFGAHNFLHIFLLFSESCGPWFHLLHDVADTFEQCGMLVTDFWSTWRLKIEPVWQNQARKRIIAQ